jgi:hypothetical protein
VNKVFFSPAPTNEGYLTPAERQTVLDGIRFSKEIGFRTVVFGDLQTRIEHYAMLFRSWISADIFLAMYPIFCRHCMFPSNPLRKLDEWLIPAMHQLRRQARAILYVIDLPIDQQLSLGNVSFVDERAYEIEKK